MFFFSIAVALAAVNFYSTASSCERENSHNNVLCYHVVTVTVTFDAVAVAVAVTVAVNGDVVAVAIAAAIAA